VTNFLTGLVIGGIVVLGVLWLLVITTKDYH
jgi:hypothetical protein